MTFDLARVRFNQEGLVPAVCQDVETGEVLMLAWMNLESLERSLTTREATYFSRSRQEIWIKGATSGHTQAIESIALDCDGDTVLLKVHQTGSACHTGDRTCFEADILLEGQS